MKFELRGKGAAYGRLLLQGVPTVAERRLHRSLLIPILLQCTVTDYSVSSTLGLDLPLTAAGGPYRFSQLPLAR